MTDVFLSYSHKDQAVTDRIVRALEAEGLSVWWDHTIPPGQTWDSFIAKGIVDAKAVIVVWSRTSAASDWVKEEASIARTHGKYLPVQTDDAEPPIGFSRIQAAQLRNWTGDRSDPQWQMLVGEVRRIMSQPQGEASSSQSHSPTPAAAPRKKKPERKGSAGAMAGVALLGVLVGAGAGGAGAAYYFQVANAERAETDRDRIALAQEANTRSEKKIQQLEEKIGPVKKPADYAAIDAVRTELNSRIDVLQNLLDKYRVPSKFVDKEVLAPVDWRGPVVDTLNKRLSLVNNEIDRINVMFANRIPVGSARPNAGP